jgi:type 1 glutamine amidotransferase
MSISKRVGALFVVATVGGASVLVTAQAPVQPSQPTPAAATRRVNALVVSGGCCHDYVYQGRMLMEAVGRLMPVDWTVVYQGSNRSTTTKFPVYDREDWAKGFDIVVHNECSADVTDEAFIRRITSAHRNGVPAVVIHCAMHSYRAAAVDDWRELLGVTSRRHTAAHQISVKVVAPGHPVMADVKADWQTPVDELYVIDKLWPGASPVATAISPEDKREYPLAWVHDYRGTRVFGTTLGHGNQTWSDPVFQAMVANGFRWAVSGSSASR